MANSFKENLRDSLDYFDMTIKELAHITGIPHRSIENYLNARSSMPPADYACRIAKALKTSVEKLVGEEDATKMPADTEEIMRLFSRISSEEKKLSCSCYELLRGRSKRP